VPYRFARHVVAHHCSIFNNGKTTAKKTDYKEHISRNVAGNMPCIKTRIYGYKNLKLLLSELFNDAVNI
jgi:hypothetical protein